MSKIVNGTCYHDNTNERVIEVLESARLNGYKVRVFYGKEGKCWNDEYDTIGTVSRSTGSQKIPLLIKNRRSLGGGAILDDVIVRIDVKDSKNKIVIVYKDLSIKFDHFVSTDVGNVYNETKDQIYARCKSGDSGKRLADFMNGKRWSK